MWESLVSDLADFFFRFIVFIGTWQPGLYLSIFVLLDEVVVPVSGLSLLDAAAAIGQHVDAPVVPDGGLEPFAVVALGPERL